MIAEEPEAVVVEEDTVANVPIKKMSDGTFVVGECAGVEAWELRDLVYA